MKTRRGISVLTVLALFGLLGIAILGTSLFQLHTEQGTVISNRAYAATSRIGGFASGDTGSGIYHAIQVRTPEGAIFNATIGCDFYPVGSSIPILTPTILNGWGLAPLSLQTGCSV